MDKISCDLENPNIDSINTCLSSLLSLSCKDFSSFANDTINNMLHPSSSTETPLSREDVINILKNSFVDTITVINDNTKLISNLMKTVLVLTDGLNCAVSAINNNKELALTKDEQLPIIDLSSVHKDISDIVCTIPKGQQNIVFGKNRGRNILIIIIILILIFVFYNIYKSNKNKSSAIALPMYVPTTM